MENLLMYCTKMLGCSGVLLLYYFLFLRDKNFHRYNRFYLLSSVLISFVLPFCRLSIFWDGNLSDTPAYIQTLDAVTIYGRMHPGGGSITSQVLVLMGIAYCLTSVIILVSFLLSLRKIFKLSEQYIPERTRGILLYNTRDQHTPFSFMKGVFWNREIELNSVKGMQIFRHEWFHATQLHSLDIVIMQLILVVAWINPFFYIFKRELVATHEFSADQFALSGANRHDYATLLVEHAISQKKEIIPANYFFYSPFKRRIQMILQDSAHSRFSRARRILVIPVILAIFCSFALRSEIYPGDKPNDSVRKGRDTIGVGDSVLTKAENEPGFPGGQSAWQTYLIKTLRYPQEAQDKEIQGPIVVEFIVDKEGNLSHIEAISGTKKGGLRQEAVRVIRESGKWIPASQHGKTVNCYKRQPIVFRLERQ